MWNFAIVRFIRTGIISHGSNTSIGKATKLKSRDKDKIFCKIVWKKNTFLPTLSEAFGVFQVGKNEVSSSPPAKYNSYTIEGNFEIFRQNRKSKL